MKNLIGSVALALSLWANPALAHAPQTPAAPMSAKDLVTMPRLGTYTYTPDERFVVYAVTVTDPQTLERTQEHFLIDLDAAKPSPVRLALGKGAHFARFGADKWLYYLSDSSPLKADKVSKHQREEAPDNPAPMRLWKVALEADGNITGPILVSAITKTSIDGFSMSPDGKKIAVWAPVSRDCPDFGCKQDGKQHLPGPGTGKLYHAKVGFVRHWDQWETPGTFNRVFVYDLVQGEMRGAPSPVDGPDAVEALVGDTPTMPYGGEEDIAWAPDSSGIYFVARQAGAEEPLSTDFNIFWSDLAGRAPDNLTGDNKALDANPAPSPDGRYLAWLAMKRPTYESDQTVIQLRELKSGKTIALTAGFDRSFDSIHWTPDSRWIIATAADRLDRPAFRIDPRSGAVKRLDLMAGNEAHISNLAPLAKSRLLFAHDSIGAPPELFISDGWKQARALTEVATSRMGALASIVTRRFSFTGAAGDRVWGQITRLEDQRGAIPAILYIHGGPQGSFNDGWSTRWNPRVLASQGYAVISVDFHGSTGYGQAFTDSINQDWGGKPLTDLQLGFAAALKLDPQIDGDNACAMGASYGGYMINWIEGNWPDRFKCLVQHDGLFDLRSFYYSTEELWFPRWDFGGSYASNSAEYERWNPVNFVEKWQTPMLVVTSQKDFRIVYSQGLQSFTALQQRKIPAQLLVFPDENHWVLGAKNSLQWHNTVFAWLARWLKAPGDK